MKKFMLMLAILMLSNLFAKSVVSERRIILPPTVTLNDPTLKNIKLSELNIESQVVANIATSTYELVFYNPNNRILEGELVFSLLDGQSVTGYAMDLNGKYREASVVPKAKAKEAYENTIRARIDPAIIEKTIGNNFKTRLYPLPAQGYKKIKITISEILEVKNSKLQYIVPFVTQNKLDKFKLDINFPSMNKKSNTTVSGMEFQSVSHGNNIILEKSDIKISKPIIIEMENPTKLSSFIQKNKDENFLFATMSYKSKTKVTKRKLPKDIAILWNNSFSNKDRDIDKELAFLKEYIQKVKVAKIQVIFFNNFKSKQIITNNFKELKEILTKTNFDGTTNFSKIDISKIKTDEILLFSAGIKTIYDGDFQNIDKEITVINSSIKSDTNLLRKIANISNGRFIDLVKLDIKEAISKFSQNKISVRVLKTSSNIYKNSAFASLSNNRLNVVGKVKLGKVSSWIKVEIKELNKTRRLKLKFKNSVFVEQNLDSLWASKKIENLSFEYKKNQDEITDLAKKYKILTKDMSFIVLDRVEDYAKYEITPPEDLRVRYEKLVKKSLGRKLYEREKAMIESIQLLQKQKSWYAKDFPKTKKPVKKMKLRNSDSHDGTGSIIGRGSINTFAPAQDNRIMNSRQNDLVMEDDMESLEAEEPIQRNNVRNSVVAGNSRILVRSKMKKSIDGSAKKELMPPPPPKLTATIKIKEFDPKASYLTEIKALPKSKWMKSYQAQKKSYLTQPMFYVDMAHLFFKNEMKKEAIVVLSNLLELDFENSEFLRVFAFKAMEFKQNDLAVRGLKQVKKIRPFEPQSFRDLALAFSKNKEYQKATENLYHILTHTWESRFSGIKIAIINELNNLLILHKNIDKAKIDPRLIAKMPVDLRIVMNWSSDNSDIDLWIIDPHGEKTFYGNKISRIGGKISNDITRGYGPEEFMIKEAVKGVYKIQANYYGNTMQKKAMPVTIRVEIYSNYGKIDEIQKDIVFRAGDRSKVIKIGEFKYGD